MRTITKEELKDILNKHKMWLDGKTDGEKANLVDTNLRGADLSCANLVDTDLRGADLRGANLSDAKLRNADLREANLSYADLRDANLRSTDLRYADLIYADLRGAKNIGCKTNCYTRGYNLVCPEEGSFIGWKSAKGKIVKLMITEDALRSSATTRKCRCSKAIVLGIYNTKKVLLCDTEVASDFNDHFIYKVGEVVEVLDYNTDRWAECTKGINFFMTFEEAVNWC